MHIREGFIKKVWKIPHLGGWVGSGVEQNPQKKQKKTSKSILDHFYKDQRLAGTRVHL